MAQVVRRVFWLLDHTALDPFRGDQPRFETRGSEAPFPPILRRLPTARRGWENQIIAAVEAKISGLARDPTIHRRRVRVKAVGRLDLLPPSTVTVLREAEKATAGYESLLLTIAIAYGG